MPASSYCEPNGQSPATWYRFASYSEHERPQIDTYAFMTTEPNALTRAINHERMPVLLSGEDQFETWLSGAVEEAFALARSFDPGAMHVSNVARKKKTCWGDRPPPTNEHSPGVGLKKGPACTGPHREM